MRYLGYIASIYFSLLVLCSDHSFPQKNPWKLYSDADGLPGLPVTAIRQDNVGYLWLLTKAGICKYDGMHFYTVQLDDSLRDKEIIDLCFEEGDTVLVVFKSGLGRYDGRSVKQIPLGAEWGDNTITTVCREKSSLLWVGTRKGLYSFEGGRLRHWGIEVGIPESEITALLADRVGRFWVGYRTEGLAVSMTRDHDTWRRYGLDQGLPQNVVNNVSEDANGTIWVSTLGGLARFAGETFVPEELNEQLPSLSISSVTVSRDGSRWLRMRGAGVAHITKNKMQIYNTSTGLLNNTVAQLLEDRDGRMWLATSGGVAKIENDSVSLLLKQDETSPKIVTAVFEDREGILWFATTEGLLKYEEGRFSTLLNIPSSAETARIQDQKIVEDHNHNLWFPTTAGLCCYDGTTFTHLTGKKGLPDTPIQHIALDESNTLWVLTAGTIYTIRDGIVQKSTDPLLINKKIVDIAPDTYGHVWCLSADQGVFVFEKGSFHNFNIQQNIAEKVSIFGFDIDQFENLWAASAARFIRIEGTRTIDFPLENVMPGAQSVYDVLASRHGSIYFTTDKGLALYSNGKYTRYTGDSLWHDQYPTWIYEDSSGTTWFGVDGNDGSRRLTDPAAAGIASFSGSNLRFYTAQDGLPSINVKSAFSDRPGSTWFLTDRGVTHFDGALFTSYSTQDGLAGSNAVEALVDRHGALWFIMQGGISTFKGTMFSKLTREDGLLHPTIQSAHFDQENNLWISTRRGVQRLRPNTIAPSVHISEIATNIGPLQLKGTANSLQGVADITIHFNGISFRSAGRRLSFFYLLEGYDNTWHGPTDQTTVTFHNLSPREYIFRVKCVNADLMESSQAIFSFTILPPFWRTLWFAGVVIGAFITLMYLLFRLRTRQLEKKSLILTQVVNQRTIELQEEKTRSEELLNNILPSPIIRELKEKGSSEPREYRSVSILFTDFIGFTNISASLPPDRLVGELNEIFKEFDQIVEDHGVEKLKTIGDAYLIASGLPTETPDHAERAISTALKMQEFIQHHNESSAFKWHMRAGIHSGQVVAGIVGKKKFTYDVWGDTVNLASRMQSSGVADRVNISAFTYDLVKDIFECEYRGKIDAKGKGTIDMYLVSKRRPTAPSS